MMFAKPKPQRKSEMAVISAASGGRMIRFNAEPRLAEMLKEFGKVFPSPTSQADPTNETFELTVDARLDFNEVLQYIESWQPQKSCQSAS
jgi:hypothetical protein